MEQTYISEFARFMDGFLAEHPEVVDDQRRRWHYYWELGDDPLTTEVAEAEAIQFDTYESNPPARAAIPARPM